MNIRLERFSKSQSLAWKRGRQLHELLEDQRAWVQPVLPKVVERYRDPSHARFNYARLARAKELVSLLVLNEADEPIGTASAIPNQQLTTEVGDYKIWGTDTDYWLRRGASAAEHTLAGEELIRFVGKNAASRLHQPESGIDEHDGMYGLSEYSSEHYVMTSVFPDAENQPLGLMTLLEPVDVPSRLITPAPKEFELAKDGATLQLYQGNFPVEL